MAARIRSIKILAFGTALLVLLATTAASSDWHSDFHFHQNCVLCQLAQLAVILTAAVIVLPPADPAPCGIGTIVVSEAESPEPLSHSGRAPPA